MDEIGPSKIIEKLKSEGKELPHMLKILDESNSENFYNNKVKYFYIFLNL